MDYGVILGRAWTIIMRYKVLWLFGILAALGTNGGTGFQYSVSGEQAQSWFGQFSQGQLAGLACVGLLIGLMVVVVVVILATMGRVGLIKGTLAAEGGAPALSFGPLWTDSRPYFWRMLILNILFIVIAVLAVIAIFIALGLLAITIVGLVIAVPAFCVLVLAIPLVMGYFYLAEVSVVADGLGPVDALGRAWGLVRERLVPVWLMGVILFLLFMGVAVVMGLAFALLMAPAAIMSGSTGPVPLICGGLILLPIALVIAGLVEAFTMAVWTLVHGRLSGRPAAPLAPPTAPADNLLPAA
jgi:hypothetical protein